MNYRVIRFFIDRDTLKDYNAGDLFPCDDPERAQQLINKCYIQRMPETAAKDVAEDKPKEPKKTTTARAKGTAKKAASKKKA